MKDLYYELLLEEQLKKAKSLTKTKLQNDRNNPAVFCSSDQIDPFLSEQEQFSRESFMLYLQSMSEQNKGMYQDYQLQEKKTEERLRKSSLEEWKLERQTERHMARNPQKYTLDSFAVFLRDASIARHKEASHARTAHKKMPDEDFRQINELLFSREYSTNHYDQNHLPYRPEIPVHEFDLTCMIQEKSLLPMLLPKEQRWFDYWLHEIKHERYPAVYAGYILLGIRRILWGIPFYNPDDPMQLVYDIWKAYEKPLEPYSGLLYTWVMYKFAIGKFKNAQVYPFSDLVQESADTGIIGAKISRSDPDKPLVLHAGQIKKLARHSKRDSSFWSHHQDLMDEAISKAVTFADVWMKDHKKKGIVRTFAPNKQIVYGRELPYAICEELYDKTARTMYHTFRYYPYEMSVQLEKFLDGILRETENILRKILKAKGSVQSSEWAKKNAALIQDLTTYLRSLYDPDYDPQNPHHIEVELDPNDIQKIRSESNQVREILKVEEQDLPQVDDRWIHPSSSIEPENPKQETQGNPRQSEFSCQQAAVPSLNQTNAVADFLDQLPHELQKTIRLIQMQKPVEDLVVLAGESFTMPDLMIDEINTRFFDPFGDILIDIQDTWQFVEEYQSAVASWCAGRKDDE